MSKFVAILKNHFTVTLNSVPTTVHIEFNRMNDVVTSGVYQTGRRTKKKESIKFYFKANARRPMIWVLKQGKGVNVPKATERQLQDQTKDIISAWRNTQMVVNNPTPSTNSPLPDPHAPIYVSRLINDRHIRRACTKKSKKTGIEFVCHATIVNKAKVNNKDLAEMEKYCADSRLVASAYAATHKVEAGTFAEYMHAHFRK
jgi:hypothetical protein